MEIWDGYYKDGTLANVDLLRGNPIPDRLYHLVCDVLVRHIDGDYLLVQRDTSKSNYGGYFEATAGGSALKGENELECIKRELYEETGIISENFTELERFVYNDDKCIFYIFLCITDIQKNKIVLQQGETISYKWVSESEFISFINSKMMIEPQKRRYFNYFVQKKYIVT